ncbi:MAG: subclass B1 metallo-beta-lactamase [Proteobacteria bacterium]|nr:subclass B1 metallo-beta-lactamase [Pseudomonadota bacterium]
MTSCGSAQKGVGDDNQIRLSDDVTVEEIAPGYWIHTTYIEVEGYGYVGANGLVVIDGRYAAMIDLPWTDKQTEILFDWVAEKHNAKIQTVVPTHSHADCAGGLNEAHRRGATSITLNKTVQIMNQTNMPVAKKIFTDNKRITVGNINIELAYIGAGHTVDNIVAWIPGPKILYAGCLLKGLDFDTIGNTSEADPSSYPETLRKMKDRFVEATIVVPGHGKPSGTDLMDHTRKLLEKYLDKLAEQETAAEESTGR